jgi:single-strand DNA-binding protein
MATRKTTRTETDFGTGVADDSVRGETITVETDQSLPRVEVTKIGNLVKDPELRYTTKGQALCEVDLAVNSRPGEEKDTEFYRLLIFGPMGENVSESDLGKSSRVIVVGSPDVENWPDKDNPEIIRTRKKIFVTAIGPDLRFATVSTVTRVHRATAKPAIQIENF